MKLRPLMLLLALVPLLTACLTTKPRSVSPTPWAEVVENIPVRQWSDNACGSGALATVLNHYGDPVTEDQLDAVFPKGRHGGVVSVDVLLEARGRGFDARLVEGDKPLVVETVKAGRPVILMLQVVDLPGDSRDYFHYVVADGHDPDRDLIRFQFGDGKVRWVPLEKLAGPWEKTGNATLLIEPASLETAVRRAVVLEETGDLAGAAESYRKLVTEHPSSSLAWTNLGNVESRRGDKAAAEASYRKAIAAEAGNRDALNNLAWLLYEQGRLEEAEPFARRAAVQGQPDANYPFDTLARILAARGKCEEAGDAWSSALQTPGLSDAAKNEIAEARRDGLARCPPRP